MCGKKKSFIMEGTLSTIGVSNTPKLLLNAKLIIIVSRCIMLTKCIVKIINYFYIHCWISLTSGW